MNLALKMMDFVFKMMDFGRRENKAQVEFQAHVKDLRAMKMRDRNGTGAFYAVLFCFVLFLYLILCCFVLFLC